MDLGLPGKRALVTGSSAGIGAAIAEELAAEGVSVVVHGRDRDRTKAVAELISKRGGHAEVANSANRRLRSPPDAAPPARAGSSSRTARRGDVEAGTTAGTSGVSCTALAPAPVARAWDRVEPRGLRTKALTRTGPIAALGRPP
jgi:uncharacterized protein YbjT (DUF2867 family)